MAISEEILVKIQADVSDLKHKLGEAQKVTQTTTSGMAGQWNKLKIAVKGVIAAYIGLKSIQIATGFIKGSIEMAQKQEAVMKKLEVAVTNAGYSYSVSSERIQEFLKQMQATTTFADDEMALEIPFFS